MKKDPARKPSRPTDPFDLFALPPGGYIDERVLARIWGSSEVLPRRKRLDGTGPRYTKIGKLVRYRVADVIEWMEANARTSTSPTQAEREASKAASSKKRKAEPQAHDVRE